MPGSLTFSNSAGFVNHNLFLNDGSTLHLDLSSVPQFIGGTNDLVTVAGDLLFDGTVSVVINALNGTLSSGVYRISAD